MWWRAAGWTFATSTRAAARIGRAAIPSEVVDAAVSELRRTVDTLLTPDEAEPSTPEHSANGRPDGGSDPLRDRAAALLDASADVEHEEDVHPAYAQIIDELAPDEVRILRLLASEGDQASIDVKKWRPFDAGSETVAPGLSMIAARASARHADRIAPYLDNLSRLGLVGFSREPVDDLAAYQVLEAQPETATAMALAGRARIVRRSVRLTPLGCDFCEKCLP